MTVAGRAVDGGRRRGGGRRRKHALHAQAGRPRQKLRREMRLHVVRHGHHGGLLLQVLDVLRLHVGNLIKRLLLVLHEQLLHVRVVVYLLYMLLLVLVLLHKVLLHLGLYELLPLLLWRWIRLHARRLLLGHSMYLRLLLLCKRLQRRKHGA